MFSISIPSLNDWNPLKSPGVLVLKQEVNKVPYNVRLIASPKYQNGALFTEGGVYASRKSDLCVLCNDIEYVKIH